jgi:hypothetical protein
MFTPPVLSFALGWTLWGLCYSRVLPVPVTHVGAHNPHAAVLDADLAITRVEDVFRGASHCYPAYPLISTVPSGKWPLVWYAAIVPGVA